MTTNPLVRKLGIKPGMRALVVGAPPVYSKQLAPLPEDVVVTSTADGTHPFVQLFANSLAEIDKSVPYLLQHAARGALLWIAYPKKTSGIESDLSRDLISEAMGGTGWRPVSIIAIDEVWSASLPASGRCQNQTEGVSHPNYFRATVKPEATRL